MIEVNNLANDYRVDKKVFSTVAKNVLKGENRETENISVAFVEKSKMREINKKYHGQDKPTDVLSFSNSEGLKFRIPEEDLGEIVICPEVVKEKKEDVIEVFIHGILHLCGYDHEKSEKEARIMESKQEFYLSNIK
jgi:probable rRNA maturation factor